MNADKNDIEYFFGDFQNIINNIRKFKSNSTDIEINNTQLSFSIDEQKNLSTNNLMQNSVIKNPSKHAGMFFSMGNLNKKNARIQKPTPKVLNLAKKTDRIRYILVTKNGEIVTVHKNPDITNINPHEEKKKTDFTYLQTRYNSLQESQRKLLGFLAISVNKWDEREQQIICCIISSLCESPGKAKNFFNTIAKNHCSSCYKITSKQHKCVHFDCLGMCGKCLGDLTNTNACPACKKPQIITCPICLEKWNIRSCKLLNCGHGICYKCCNRKWNQMNEDITICPLCRK